MTTQPVLFRPDSEPVVSFPERYSFQIPPLTDPVWPVTFDESEGKYVVARLPQNAGRLQTSSQGSLAFEVREKTSLIGSLRVQGVEKMRMGAYSRRE